MADRESLPEDLRGLLSLDDSPGPAMPLGEVALSVAAKNVVESATAPAPSVAPAAGATLSVGKVATASGVVAAVAVASFFVLRPAVNDGALLPTSTMQRGVETSAHETPAVSNAASEGGQSASAVTAAIRDDMLKKANLLRGAGKYREAERVYVQLLVDAPGSQAAYVARVAAADLRREHLQDPQGALTLYRDALRSQGTLSLEAARGIAQAQRMLGDVEQERRALRELIEASPEDASAAWAKRRLAEIGDAP